jgi:hypothetical protein
MLGANYGVRRTSLCWADITLPAVNPYPGGIVQPTGSSLGLQPGSGKPPEPDCAGDREPDPAADQPATAFKRKAGGLQNCRRARRPGTKLWVGDGAKSFYSIWMSVMRGGWIG